METRELERIHFTTRHFNDLQGLRYDVPLGLITLGLGGPMLLRAGFFLGALLLIVGARRYYRNTFGAVERQQVDLDADLYPFSVFSPAGPIQRLEGTQQVPPMMRRFLVTLALAVTLFSIAQAMPSSFKVEGARALGQHPRISSLPSGFRERPWIVGRQPQPAGILQPPWVAWVYSLAPARPPSMLRAVFAQATYLLFGSFFLSVWLWRERRGSQGYQLALAVLLLGLAVLGTCLGFLARTDGLIPPLIDPLLPALIYPDVALVVCGSAMVLAGLLDHWQLFQALGVAPPQMADRS
jgi:hypothetical protein